MAGFLSPGISPNHYSSLRFPTDRPTPPSQQRPPPTIATGSHNHTTSRYSRDSRLIYSLLIELPTLPSPQLSSLPVKLDSAAGQRTIPSAKASEEIVPYHHLDHRDDTSNEIFHMRTRSTPGSAQHVTIVADALIASAPKRKAEESVGDASLAEPTAKRLQNWTSGIGAALLTQDAAQISAAGPSRSPSRSTSPRGRGRGRGSGRGRGRGGPSRGGAGGRAPGGSRLQEISRDPSPSDSKLTQLRHRQRQLSAVFSAIAPFHASALDIISNRTQNELRQKKNAHKKVPDYVEIKADLGEVLSKRMEGLKREYEIRKSYREESYTREKAKVIMMYRAQIEHLHDEHKLGSQGDYMALMEAARGAEDDAGTEMASESTTLPHEYHPTRSHALPRLLTESIYRPRGFNSPLVPRPDYLRMAAEGFDSSTRKDILVEEIVPLVRQIDSEAVDAQCRLTADDITLTNMADAADFLKQQKAAPALSPPPPPPPPPMANQSSLALQNLADAAIADASSHRQATVPAQPHPAQPALSPTPHHRHPGRVRKPTVRAAPRNIAPAPSFAVSALTTPRPAAALAALNSQQQQWQQIMPAPPFHNQPALSVPRTPTPRAPRALLPAPPAGPVHGGHQGL